jgi:hypothetical protein
MFDIMIKFYKVYDTETNCDWVTPKGKTIWNKPNHAKNAVNANPPEFMWQKDHRGNISKHHAVKFSQQNRLVIEEAIYTLVTTTQIS